MEKSINLLIITDNFNYNCGVSKHLYYLINDLPQNVNAYFVIPGGTATELLKTNRVKFFIVPSLSYQKRSISNLVKAIFSIYRLAKKLNVDIIHSHNYYAANAARVVGKITGITTVQTIHSYFERRGILKKYSADYYILVSEYLAFKAKEEKAFGEERMKVIYNGVKIISIDKKDARKNHNGKLELLVASRLIYEKGIQTVIEALSLLPEEDRQKINFKIAGTGEYKSALKQFATEKKVKAVFLGEVVDMVSLFSSCDIFLLPSFADGLPMALLEAGAHECFIITSDFEGILSIFRPGIDGFIYEKHSAKQLADAITRAIKLGNEREQYITSFKYMLNKRFTSGIMAQSTYDYYTQILKRADA